MVNGKSEEDFGDCDPLVSIGSRRAVFLLQQELGDINC